MREQLVKPSFCHEPVNRSGQMRVQRSPSYQQQRNQTAVALPLAQERTKFPTQINDILPVADLTDVVASCDYRCNASQS